MFFFKYDINICLEKRYIQYYYNKYITKMLTGTKKNIVLAKYKIKKF